MILIYTTLKEQLYDLLEGFGLANTLPVEQTKDYRNQKPSSLDVISNYYFREVNNEIGIADYKPQRIHFISYQSLKRNKILPQLKNIVSAHRNCKTLKLNQTRMVVFVYIPFQILMMNVNIYLIHFNFSWSDM